MAQASFKLTCDSTADMPESFYKESDITYIPFHFILDGQDYADDNGRSVPFDDFYARMAAGSTPSTSCVSTGGYLGIWEPILRQGHDILHIGFSSGLSASLDSAVEAQRELTEKYPERTLIVIDSLAASSGYGLLVTKARDFRDEGHSLQEVADWVEANKLKFHHWFFSTDLTSYVRGGRISRTSWAVGTMLKICPLLNVNTEGKLIPREKLRGKKKAMTTIVQRMREHAQGGTAYSGRCYICQSACYDDARIVADDIEASFPHLQGKVLITPIGTVIGSHTGPGTIAVFFEGDERVL